MDRAAILTSWPFLVGVTSGVVATRGARLVACFNRVGSEDTTIHEWYVAVRADVHGRLLESVAVDTEAEALAVLDEFQAAEDLSLDLVNTATMVLERDGAEDERSDVIAVRSDAHAVVELSGSNGTRLVLVSATESGRLVNEQHFEAGELMAALRSLDQRYYDEPRDETIEGTETFAALADAFDRLDADAMAALYTADVAHIDHRWLHQMTTNEDRAELVADDMELLAGTDSFCPKILRTADHLGLVMFAVTDRRSGGERWMSQMVTVLHERDGLIDVYETWEVEDLAAANARFDELLVGGRSIARRVADGLNAAILVGDADSYAALLADEARGEDRRPLMRTDLDREELLANLPYLRTASAAPIDVNAARFAIDRLVWEHDGNLVEFYRLIQVSVDEKMLLAVFLDSEADAGDALNELQAAEDLSLDLVNTSTMVVESDAVDDEQIEVIAVRGDCLALVEWRTADSAGLALVSVTVGGTIVGEERFPLDQVPAALRSLDRQWVAGIGDDATAGLDTFVASLAAVNPFDRDALSRLWDPDMSLTSHLSLGQLLSSASREEALGKLSSFLADSDSDSIGAKVMGIADHLVLAVYSVSQRRPGSDRWATGMIQLVRERRGVIDLVEAWDLDDRALAVARFHELAAGPEKANARRAGAPAVLIRSSVVHHADPSRDGGVVAAPKRDGPSNALTELIVSSPRDSMSPELDYMNHASLGDPDGSLAELSASAASYAEQGWTTEYDAIAVAGEGHGVLRARVVAADGQNFMAFVFSAAAGDDGLVAVVHGWDVEDMRLALADCRRRYLDANPDLTEPVRSEYEFEILWNEHDIGALVALLTDDFRLVDHRLGSVLGEMDRDQWFEFQTRSVEEMPRLASWMDVIASTGDANLVRHRRWSDPALTPDWDFYVVSSWTRDGMRSAAVFDLDQEAEARACLDELTVPDVRNAASDTYVVDFAPATWTDDPGDLSHLIADDMVYDVHKPGTGGGGGLAELLATGASWASVGFERMRLDVVSVRGERHALVTGTNATEDGYEVAMAGVVECGEDGRIIYLGIWDDSDLRLAAAEYGRRILDVGGETYPTRALTELMCAANNRDTEKMAAVFSPDVVREDHSQAGFGQLSDWQFRKANQVLTEMVPELALTSPIVLRQAGNAAMELNRRAGISTDGGEVNFDLLLVYEVVDGLIMRFEAFEPDDRAGADARFDELTAERG